jgi:hypothetical protein
MMTQPQAVQPTPRGMHNVTPCAMAQDRIKPLPAAEPRSDIFGSTVRDRLGREEVCTPRCCSRHVVGVAAPTTGREHGRTKLATS